MGIVQRAGATLSLALSNSFGGARPRRGLDVPPVSQEFLVERREAGQAGFGVVGGAPKAILPAVKEGNLFGGFLLRVIGLIAVDPTRPIQPSKLARHVQGIEPDGRRQNHKKFSGS
jgi:hypothetical protein